MTIETTMNYRKIAGTVEYSHEDEMYYGKLLDTYPSLWLYGGNTKEELKAAFENTVDEYYNHMWSIMS